MKNKIVVAISEFPPLVINSRGKYSGFEIELWEKIAANLRLKYEYKFYDFQKIIPLLAEKKVDVGLAGITINAARERIVDFSHPTLNSGLSIVTSKNKISLFGSARNFFAAAKRLIKPMLLIVFFVVFFGHLFWFIEGDKTFTHGYYPGVVQSMWLVICNMTTDSFGDFVPHTALGRVVIIFELFTGIAIFGLMIGEVTAFITEKKIGSAIGGVKDLKGKNVATMKDTTAEKALEKLGAIPVTSKRIEDSYRRLNRTSVDALVFDTPAVFHYLKTKGEGKFELAGDTFEKQHYGFAFKDGSALREKVNRELLKLRESGFYDEIYRKWFGEETEME